MQSQFSSIERKFITSTVPKKQKIPLLQLNKRGPQKASPETSNILRLNSTGRSSVDQPSSERNMNKYLKEFSDDFNVSHLPFKKHVISKKEIVKVKQPEEISESWVMNVDLNTVDNDEGDNQLEPTYFLNKTPKQEE